MAKGTLLMEDEFMKRTLSLFLSIIIIVLSVISYVQKPLIAKAEENNIQSFINETVELIKENDDKVFVAENEEKIETASYEPSIDKTENTTYQTCRLIVKSDTTPDKLNSIGIASGFLDYHIIQFKNEEDTKNAFNFYSECDYVEDVFCDRVFNTSSDYTVDQSNQITYSEEVPERLDSWGSQVTGMYELIDYIKSNYNLSDLPQIEVAVLDSGVDLRHEFFQGRLIKKSFNSSGDGVEKSENDTEYGHGTNVTSVIVDNTLENVKVSNYKISHKGNGSFAGFIAGVLQATEDEVDIINMSFSFWGTSKEEQDLAESVVNAAIEKGCLVVSSSGNYNIDIDYQYSVPTSIGGVISVAASSIINYPTSWSSRGKSVSVMAPGENIPVANPNDKYVLTSGTSFSSPLTVSLYALLKTLYPSESNKQLQIRVESTADESDLEGIVNMYGYGIIDAIGASSLKRAETPIINNENEIYEGKAEIKITVPENSVVYYTMDQTYPSKDNGILYDKDKPIVIEDDFFLIHAVAYSEDGFRSEYVSELIQAATLGTNDMFEINNDGIITNYCGSVNYLKIPNEINGIKVLGFSENLFSESNFHGVWFSDEITTITSSLFYNNFNLQYISGKGITKIKSNAFYNCNSLYKINFPATTEIEENAFYGTTELSGIYFEHCTYIGEAAFYCSGVRYINLPSVKTICAYAFEKCTFIYEFYAPSLTELRGRLYKDGVWYADNRFLQNASINCVLNFENLLSYPYGCFYQANVKRIEFSNIKSIGSLPITYCKKPLNGSITVVMPSTLEECGLDRIPTSDSKSDYNIRYTVYGMSGTFAEQWAKENNSEFIEITPQTAVITDLPEHYYSYMRPLEADVVGFNRIYKWYGTNTYSYDNAQLLQSSDKKSFDPNEHKQYKYYYCVVKSSEFDGTEDDMDIYTGICENKSYKPYSPPTSNGRVTIATPSNRYLKYGESINLYANATGLPEGSKIKWRIVEGIGVTLDPSASGTTCTVTSKSNGFVTIEAYAVNKNGNTIVNEKGNRICDREGISSEVSLWWIILYYIRQIFSVTNTAIQLIY